MVLLLQRSNNSSINRMSVRSWAQGEPVITLASAPSRWPHVIEVGGVALGVWHQGVVWRDRVLGQHLQSFTQLFNYIRSFLRQIIVFRWVILKYKNRKKWSHTFSNKTHTVYRVTFAPGYFRPVTFWNYVTPANIRPKLFFYSKTWKNNSSSLKLAYWRSGKRSEY